ncbi:MAG: DUF5103 domain-containing protein [Bacteroidales bacterium]
MQTFIRILLFHLLVLILPPATAQEVFRTEVNSSLIKTLQVKIEGETLASEPVIELNGGKRIEIHFDALEHHYNRFAYSIEHCDADWRKSSLAPIEYMNGFQGLTITDFANSIVTTTQYVHYCLPLSNEAVELKVSGNYAVRVYRENEPDKALLTACFSVVEPLVALAGEITGNTLTDYNKEHQQVNFTLFLKNLPVAQLVTDLKLFVYQNHRRDNAVTGILPTSILSDRLIYEQVRDLIYEAGNEYRRMEFLSHRYNGMGVDKTRFFNPYYHIDLLPGFPRSRSAYSYDEDQNGRFLIRCSGCNDPDIEADYYIVHFFLKTDPLPGGSLHLSGDMLNNIIGENSRMSYNAGEGQYEKAILLKQGNYNYQYLFVPAGATQGETTLTEGNHYQTENEYAIFVYYRPMGERYDRLVGVATLNNNPKNK